jgi:hypothetical protein
MEPVELRKAFAAFLGEERFRKFVATGWPLRFWQEQEWHRFSSTHPELASRLDLLQVAIRVCELHGDELQPDQVELFHGCIDYAQDYIDTRDRLFPHAANDPVSTEGTPTQGDHVAVWFCPGCRAAKQQWNARREERWNAPRQ